jgi:hypothetical protein
MQKATERQEGDVNAVTFIQGGRVDHGRRPWSLPPDPSLVMRGSAWVALICVIGGCRSP